MQAYIVLASLLLAASSSSSPTSVNTPRDKFYDRCRLQVVHWYKNEKRDTFLFDLCLTDGNGTGISNTFQQPVEDYDYHECQVGLPYTLVIMPGYAKEDPVYFKYGGYGFSSTRGCKANDTDPSYLFLDCSFAC